MPEPRVQPAAARAASLATVLVALIVGQICLHSTMAGIRMAAPLWVLRQSHAEWAVGVLVGLFAVAPIALALHAGRLADRHGYHRPLHIAVALTVVGGAFAVLSTWWPAHDFLCLCAAAVFTGAGANCGLIAIQRTAGRSAHDATELKRVFSWLGLAPALSNVTGAASGSRSRCSRCCRCSRCGRRDTCRARCRRSGRRAPWRTARGPCCARRGCGACC